jgi:hypothetical protein
MTLIRWNARASAHFLRRLALSLAKLNGSRAAAQQVEPDGPAPVIAETCMARPRHNIVRVGLPAHADAGAPDDAAWACTRGWLQTEKEYQ